jgi:HlyD family secretion protein
MRCWVCRSLLVTLILIPAGCDPEAVSDAPGGSGKSPAVASKAKEVRVAKGPFKIEVPLKGVFEAAAMTEIALRPEAWTPDNRATLTVLKAVEQGARVKKGDTLVWLDLEKIDQAIEDQKNSCRLAELAVKLADEELPVARKSAPLELASAERARRVADEDLKKFLDQDRAFSEKTARHTLKEAKDGLEYTEEELRQLEKMYRSKDLTEETERIILQRQRNRVESSRFRLEETQIRSDRTLKLDLPRQEQALKENAEKQALALEKLRASQPLTLNQKILALDKLKYDRDRANDRLTRLTRDRTLMAVTAPVEGIVYYGKCNRGQWTTAAAVASRLQRGGTLTPEEVFLTIAQPGTLFARANIDEKDLHAIRPGAEVRVTPVPYPDQKLSGKIESVSAIPLTAGTFEARVFLEQGKTISALVPGMACTVKVLAYRKNDTLTLPAAAVHADDFDDGRDFVYLATKSGPTEKRIVSLGQRSGDRVEITQGLKEGDRVLLGKPADGPESAGSKKEGSE